MMRLLRLVRDDRGTALVEFGLLLPVILGTFLGVLQVGMSMFAYNSLRNVTAEASRFALVEYQNGREMADWTALEDRIEALAPGSGLATDRLNVEVERAATQRVTGAIELRIDVSYRVQSLLPFLGISDFETNYTRPVFLIEDASGASTIGTPGTL